MPSAVNCNAESTVKDLVEKTDTDKYAIWFQTFDQYEVVDLVVALLNDLTKDNLTRYPLRSHQNAHYRHKGGGGNRTIVAVAVMAVAMDVAVTTVITVAVE